ncbi:ATP-binding cassette domain-containing protein [Fulvivirgaceae bacterium BMA10]|uniref:ATP-binding cassette domain-containing protein n=1 Tax=Splendidivirga corallicola TaxID=3051826 RepID=A0ABT8KXY3_9BACT|nr:ATP-binding cassette domain-containing protein [Fulvivirgaceae bacterium BMA10]
MISIKDLIYQYNSETRISFPDWQLDTRGQALILGKSGCGKTTLLHLLGGLLQPSSGSVFIDDQDLTKLTGSELDHFRGQHIGFVFQKPHLIKALNVQENLFLAQHLAGIPKDKERVLEVLKTLDLLEKRKSKVYELSEGQAQRASIARAVLNKPALILADEPTSSLDDENCARVIEILLDQAKSQGAALVIATHDQRLKNQVQSSLNL